VLRIITSLLMGTVTPDATSARTHLTYAYSVQIIDKIMRHIVVV